MNLQDFVAAAAELHDADAQVQTAMITAISTVLVALVGVFSARRYIHPKTPKKDPDVKTGPEPTLAAYSGDQNEFIALVIKDSKDLHERIDSMSDKIDQMRNERTAVIGAFGRYVMKLALSWGSGGQMPYPDEEDMALLEETLPADWRRRKH